MTIQKNRKLYAIYDKKRTAFLQLMEKANNAVAIRDFNLIVNSNESLIKKYPEDYKLTFIGTFDEETGELSSEGKTDICQAIEVLDEVK